MYLRSEGINSFVDFEKRFDSLKQEKNEKKDSISKNDYNTKFYLGVYKTLTIYNQYSNIGQQYESGSSFTKKKIYKEHENEIRSFLYAKHTLEEKGIDTSINPEKIRTQIDKMKTKMDDEKKELNGISDCISEAQKYKAIIENGLRINRNKEKIIKFQRDFNER